MVISNLKAKIKVSDSKFKHFLSWKWPLKGLTPEGESTGVGAGSLEPFG